MTCTATKSATQGDIDAGSIDNTAIASGTPPAGGPVSDTDDATVTATANPSITIDKSATPNNVISAGQTVSYAFLVTNTGNVTLTGVVVDDPLTGPGSVGCPGSTLLPGESITCSATYNVTPGDMNNGVIDNTATVTGTPPSGPDVDDTDTESVTAVAAPAIQIVKTATPATITAAGQTVTYTFTVTNTGNVSLTAVVVSDPLPGLGPISCPGTTLTIGTSMTCSASYVTTQADVDAGSYSNTATATGTPPTGPSVSDTSSAVVIANRAPALTLDKSSSPSTVSSAGQTITYSFLVTNTGNVTLTSVTVGDPLPGLSAVSCPSMTLSPGASTTCTATKLATQGDIDAGVINNTATVTATPPGGGTVAAIDSHTVTAPPASSITLVKTASPTTIASVGQLINYSFVVTNTGNVTLTGVGVSDPKPGMSPVTCPTTTLAPSVSTTCTATYTTILADVNQGSIDNTATASGTPPSGPAVSDVDSETVTATQAPTITIDKSASPNNVSTVGQPVTYSFLITNTGNVTLTGVTVVDPIAGLSAISCPTTVLDPGTMTTCTATWAVTQSDLDSGSISNTATVTGTPPNGSDVTGTDTATVTVTAGPAIQLDKTATPTTVRTLSDTISYTFVVTNTGNVTLSAITVADPMLGGAVACPATTLAPTATMTCTASHGVTQADLDTGPILNTATVTGTPNVGPSVSDTDAATVLADPVDGMTLVKSATPSIIDAAGTSITYAFVVENTGDSTLDDVSISDPLVGLSAVACPSTTIAPGGQLTCTATYVATQADVDSGAVTNTATATATPGAGTPLTATDTVIVTATRTPSISLVKTATPETVGSAGAVVTFGFLATNTGNVTLTNVVVSDPMPGLSVVTCPGFAGLLAPGASTSCTATYTVTQADIDAGAIHNTATASGRAFFTGASGGTTVVSTGAVTVTLAQTPAIQIVKSVSAATVDDGTTVTYSFVVTNIGNMVLNDVRVEDPLARTELDLLSRIRRGTRTGRVDHLQRHLPGDGRGRDRRTDHEHGQRLGAHCRRHADQRKVDGRAHGQRDEHGQHHRGQHLAHLRHRRGPVDRLGCRPAARGRNVAAARTPASAAPWRRNMIGTRVRELVRVAVAVALGCCLAACSDDGATSADPPTATTDRRGTSDELELAAESADDPFPDDKSESAAEPSGDDDPPAATVPPEAQIDVSTAPGTGEFVGALEDVQDLACSGDDGVWTAAGTVVNPTVGAVDYRIYVSFLDAGGETVGLIEANADDVAAGAEQEWSAEIQWPTGDLRCVLRVERIEP